MVYREEDDYRLLHILILFLFFHTNALYTILYLIFVITFQLLNGVGFWNSFILN